MQLTLDLEEFNIFMMLYIKAAIFEDVDHKKGLLSKIENSNNPEAKLLFKDRENLRREGKFDIHEEARWNDKLHAIMPDLNMKSVTEFDTFLQMLSARNMDDWLMQRYFRQQPQMRLYLRRFIDQLETDEDLKIRLIV